MLLRCVSGVICHDLVLGFIVSHWRSSSSLTFIGVGRNLTLTPFIGARINVYTFGAMARSAGEFRSEMVNVSRSDFRSTIYAATNHGTPNFESYENARTILEYYGSALYLEISE